MPNNSIKDNLTKEDIISNIRLLLQADIIRKNVILVVEGEDDVKFWLSIVAPNVYVYPSLSGKIGIKDIIEEHFDNDYRVIGIRDRDYEYRNIHSRIFFYDHSCLEIMIISNDEVFRSVFAEYYPYPEPFSDVRNLILYELRFLSLLRKYNEVEFWGIKIDGISISNAVTKKKKINNQVIVDKINEMNDDFLKKNEVKHKKVAEEAMDDYQQEELLQITQGHDFIYYFAELCKRPKGRSIGEKNIAASLRCAYRKQDIQGSNLYSIIKDFEKNTNLVVV